MCKCPKQTSLEYKKQQQQKWLPTVDYEKKECRSCSPYFPFFVFYSAEHVSIEVKEKQLPI